MKIDPTPIFAKLVELDMTREEACARAKISRDTLRKIEKGRLVNLKSVKRLCLSLGIKPQEVLVHEGNKHNAAHGPSGSVASHRNAGMFNTMKEEMIEEFAALLKETTDRDALEGIMRTIKLFRRGSR